MPTDTTALSRTFLKEMRAIAHHLKPIVTLGAAPSESALAELDRALTDHELVKVRVNISDREERAEAIETAAAKAKAVEVQRIGRIVVLYRANPNADPELSNAARQS